MLRSTGETGAAPLPPARTRRQRRKDEPLTIRFLARFGAVMLLGMSLLYGLAAGEHFESVEGPASRLPGRIASFFGHAADDIRITGLKWQSYPAVLSAIGVKPRGPLIGFDPATAKRLLENLDWVESATVQRLFPNRLEIHLVEREPFAIWLRDGAFYVIDKTGTAISSVGPGALPGRLVVSGEGAQRAAASLVNQLEAHPGLRSRLWAAARVGDRRWTLHFKGNVEVLLPDAEVERALEALGRLHAAHGILDKGVSDIDLRLVDSILVTPLEDPRGDKAPLVASRR